MKEKDNVFRGRKPVKNVKPLHIYGFDIETCGTNNDFVCAVLYGKDGEVRFRTREDCIQYFLKSSTLKNALVYATNLEFDFFGTFFTFVPFAPKERNGILYSVKLFQDTQEAKPLTFRDTMRIVPFGVKKLGDMVGIPKLEYPFKNAKGKAVFRRPVSFSEWNRLFEYCSNDAQISYTWIDKIFLKFCADIHIRPQVTAASTAMMAFRTHFLKEWWFPAPHDHNVEMFRAYKGARTECFARGVFGPRKGGVVIGDVNSLYPTVMQGEFPHPNFIKRILHGCMDFIEKYDGISEIVGFQPPTHYPILGINHDDKLLFPCGVIKGWFTHVELREALADGFIINTIGVQFYSTQTFSPFVQYVKYFYDMRLEMQHQKNPMETMVKLMLNSLYGKFCFDYIVQDYVIDDKSITDETRFNALTIAPLRAGFSRVYIENTEVPDYVFPMIGAYISAYARLHITRILKETKGKALYCDTDSVFIEAKHSTIKDSEKLGEMKIEYGHKPVKRVCLVKPKFYCVHGQTPKIKGVHTKNPQPGDVTVQTYDEFVAYLKDPFTLVSHDFVRLRTLMHDTSLKPNQIRRRTKILDFEDTKREWKNTFNVNEKQWSTPRTLVEKDYENEKETLVNQTP